MRIHLSVDPSCLDVLGMKTAAALDPDVVTIVVGGRSTRTLLELADFTPTRLISPPLGSRLLGYPVLRKLSDRWRKPEQLVVWSNTSLGWGEWLWPTARVDSGHVLLPAEDVSVSLEREMAGVDRAATRRRWLEAEADSDAAVLIGLLTDQPASALLESAALGVGISHEIEALPLTERPRLILESGIGHRPQVESLWTEGTLPHILLQEPSFAWPWPWLGCLEMVVIASSSERPEELVSLARHAGLPVILEGHVCPGLDDDRMMRVPAGDSQSMTSAMLSLWPREPAQTASPG
ncbi:hypothetical protein [Mucisphaera calidilacus]|uniref:Uncharacterized protein n=1 Tax=Mucisphaera calidilacus TaxID=2527982 RepID=A0A518BW24_9BACT|nr:hypothetical protein [Mucisphaera calidilacus]QDU71161.1 hypothetical protein Pan265_10100 [Mucisphaera calidilacus]